MNEMERAGKGTSKENPYAAQQGIPGFHNRMQGDRAMAAMELDDENDQHRVDTGTGDQPGNAHGDRFATPNQPAHFSSDDDKRAIRDLVDQWWAASRTNEVDTVLGLIADDALFMVNGAEPFGKAAFEQQARKMKHAETEGHTDVLEIEVNGTVAWMRAIVHFAMTPPNGQRIQREGYVLSVLHKKADGHWVLFREANLMPAMDVKG